MVGIIIALVSFSLLVFIAMFIAMWKVYVKAGVEGWWSIIPIANFIKLCQIAGVKALVVIISFCCLFAGVLVTLFVPLIGGLLSFAGMLVTIISVYVIYVKLFRRFGLKGLLWGLCAVCMPFIGIAVIAFNPYIEYDF